MDSSKEEAFVALKKEGDDSYLNHSFDDAIRAYTNALALKEDHHIVLSNRCACYLQVSNGVKALQDADQCIKLKPKWSRGYSRRGSALFELKRFHSSILAYEECIQLEPTNIIVQKALADTKEIYNNKLMGDFSALDNAIKETEDSKMDDMINDISGDKETEVVIETKLRVTDDAIIESSTSIEQIERLIGDGKFKWKNLNPFFVLLLPGEATIEDIKQRYRKLSTLVHPDKCSDSRTRDAFEVVKNAFMNMKEKSKRQNAAILMKGARKVVEKERKRLLSKGVVEEELGDLEDAVKKEILKVFAQAEQKRLQSKKTKVAYKKREREAEIEEEEKRRAEMLTAKEWAEGTEHRVGDWRTFMGGKNKHSKLTASTLKIPALQTETRAGEHHDKAGTSYKKKWR